MEYREYLKTNDWKEKGSSHEIGGVVFVAPRTWTFITSTIETYSMFSSLIYEYQSPFPMGINENRS